ncbi:MAG: fumarylacetoacetate hydrolase family protein [Rhodocyclaceae bacterium]
MSSQFVFPLEIPAVPIAGGEVCFPVRRIWCVGRNYADHAREMGADPEREPPFFFSKPADAIVPGGGSVPYPPRTQKFQHEVELVVAIGKPGVHIVPEAALEHVFAYGLGVDLTRRDLQQALREKGHPWEMAKAFDHSAPVSVLRPASELGHPASGAIRLAVNGVERQSGDLADMIWPVPDIVANLSTYVALAPGDLIFTGTPAGVGTLVIGDQIACSISGLGTLDFAIAAAIEGQPR